MIKAQTWDSGSAINKSWNPRQDCGWIQPKSRQLSGRGVECCCRNTDCQVAILQNPQCPSSTKPSPVFSNIILLQRWKLLRLQMKRNRGRWVIKVDELSKRGLVRGHDLHYTDVWSSPLLPSILMSVVVLVELSTRGAPWACIRWLCIPWNCMEN